MIHILLPVAVLFVFVHVGHRFLRKSPFAHIAGPPSQSWVMGNLGQLFNAKGLAFHQGLVDSYGGMVKVFGFFGDEQLYISDPKAIYSIFGNDQDAFEETAVFLETNKVIFGPGLVATSGEQHKRQRKLVLPVFSVLQLKALVPTLYAVSERLVEAISAELDRKAGSPSKHDAVDMNEWMCRVALEMIGQSVLGYSFDPLNSPHNNPYTSAIKELIPTIFSLSLVRQFAPFLSRMGSPSFRRWLVERTPHQAVQKVLNISDVMHNTAVGILDEKRKESGTAREGKDIISVLLRANENASAGEKMSDNELTGQMTVFIFGAQDTTSSALSRILYLLAQHPIIQEELRAEILEAAELGQHRLGYDEIVNLPLLDAVIKETLRLYPPVPFVRRTAVKSRTLAYALPSGEGATVAVPKVWGLDAKEWKPERWLRSSGNVASSEFGRLPGIYSGTLSFLAGNRSCVGYKFAQVEMKIMLARLLTTFKFTMTDAEILWNLSQIISPSVRKDDGETKGLPLAVQRL